MKAGLAADEIRNLEIMADRQDELERRLERMQREFSPEDELPELCADIADIEQIYDRMARMGSPYMDRALMLLATDYERKKKLRNRLQARLRHTVYAEDSVTDDDIEKARSVPLESIVQVPRTKMVHCPFHNDKNPSFWIANGFGYCHSCNEWADSIKWVMKVENKTFLEAVKSLR